MSELRSHSPALWEDVLPADWVGRVKTSPLYNALASYAGRAPAGEAGMQRASYEMAGAGDPIERMRRGYTTAAQEYPEPGFFDRNPRAAELANNVGFLANFIGPPAAKLPPVPKPQGIRAYHGSPHDFDKFDLSKIGTGEGAQAYGRGLYFAENESVARYYKNQFKDPSETIASSLLDNAGGDRHLAARRAAALAKSIDPNRGWIRSALSMSKPDAALSQHFKKSAEMLRSEVPFGRMYEVNINARPEQFLDWDKPLNGQSEHVRNLFNDRLKAGGIETRPIGRHADGTELVDVFQKGGGSFGVYPRDRVPGVLDRPVDHYPGATGRDLTQGLGLTEDVLRSAGIPGIRYKDQMSRGIDGGTSNYVVFDDKMIEILRKYGLLPPVAAAAAGAANYQEPPL